jgi:glycosyltransferase involved in cell wall biosynthesis
MAIAEAMSLGLPVIAGRHTDGVGWQLDQGRAGILVDVTDPEETARGIAAATGDVAAWRAMSAAARSRAGELFSIDRVVDQ